MPTPTGRTPVTSLHLRPIFAEPQEVQAQHLTKYLREHGLPHPTKTDYFEVLTGHLRPRENSANIIDRWLCDKVLDAAEGVKTSEKHHKQALLAADSLVRQVGATNALAILSRGYQMAHQLSSRGALEERQASALAAEIFEAELNKLLLDHDPINMNELLFSKDDIPDIEVFTQSITKAQKTNNVSYSIKYLASGIFGALLLGVGASYAYQALGRGAPQNLNLAKAATRTPSMPPPAPTMEMLKEHLIVPLNPKPPIAVSIPPNITAPFSKASEVTKAQQSADTIIERFAKPKTRDVVLEELKSYILTNDLSPNEWELIEQSLVETLLNSDKPNEIKIASDTLFHTLPSKGHGHKTIKKLISTCLDKKKYEIAREAYQHNQGYEVALKKVEALLKKENNKAVVIFNLLDIPLTKNNIGPSIYSYGIKKQKQKVIELALKFASSHIESNAKIGMALLKSLLENKLGYDEALNLLAQESKSSGKFKAESLKLLEKLVNLGQVRTVEITPLSLLESNIELRSKFISKAKSLCDEGKTEFTEALMNKLTSSASVEALEEIQSLAANLIHNEYYQAPLDIAKKLLQSYLPTHQEIGKKIFLLLVENGQATSEAGKALNHVLEAYTTPSETDLKLCLALAKNNLIPPLKPQIAASWITYGDAVKARLIVKLTSEWLQIQPNEEHREISYAVANALMHNPSTADRLLGVSLFIEYLAEGHGYDAAKEAVDTTLATNKSPSKQDIVLLNALTDHGYIPKWASIRTTIEGWANNCQTEEHFEEIYDLLNRWQQTAPLTDNSLLYHFSKTLATSTHKSWLVFNTPSIPQQEIGLRALVRLAQKGLWTSELETIAQAALATKDKQLLSPAIKLLTEGVNNKQCEASAKARCEALLVAKDLTIDQQMDTINLSTALVKQGLNFGFGEQAIEKFMPSAEKRMFTPISNLAQALTEKGVIGAPKTVLAAWLKNTSPEVKVVMRDFVLKLIDANNPHFHAIYDKFLEQSIIALEVSSDKANKLCAYKAYKALATQAFNGALDRVLDAAVRGLADADAAVRQVSQEIVETFVQSNAKTPKVFDIYTAATTQQNVELQKYALKLATKTLFDWKTGNPAKSMAYKLIGSPNLEVRALAQDLWIAAIENGFATELDAKMLVATATNYPDEHTIAIMTDFFKRIAAKKHWLASAENLAKTWLTEEAQRWSILQSQSKISFANEILDAIKQQTT